MKKIIVVTVNRKHHTNIPYVYSLDSTFKTTEEAKTFIRTSVISRKLKNLTGDYGEHIIFRSEDKDDNEICLNTYKKILWLNKLVSTTIYKII